jgi:hypothetical protein
MSLRVLIDECCHVDLSRSFKGFDVLYASKGTSDLNLVDIAREKHAIIVTENKRDIVRWLKHRVAGSGGEQGECRDGCGVIRVANGCRRINIEDARARLKLNGRLIDWDEVVLLNLLVSIGTNGQVTVSTLPRCRTCIAQHGQCQRCTDLGLDTSAIA